MWTLIRPLNKALHLEGRHSADRGDGVPFLNHSVFSADAVQKEGLIQMQKRLAALLLALALLPALALAEEDPVVVQIGKVSYHQMGKPMKTVL